MFLWEPFIIFFYRIDWNKTSFVLYLHLRYSNDGKRFERKSTLFCAHHEFIVFLHLHASKLGTRPAKFPQELLFDAFCIVFSHLQNSKSKNFGVSPELNQIFFTQFKKTNVSEDDEIVETNNVYNTDTLVEYLDSTPEFEGTTVTEIDINEKKGNNKNNNNGDSSSKDIIIIILTCLVLILIIVIFLLVLYITHNKTQQNKTEQTKFSQYVEDNVQLTRVISTSNDEIQKKQTDQNTKLSDKQSQENQTSNQEDINSSDDTHDTTNGTDTRTSKPTIVGENDDSKPEGNQDNEAKGNEDNQENEDMYLSSNTTTKGDIY